MKLKYKIFNWLTDGKIKIKETERPINYSNVIAVLEEAGYVVINKEK